MPIWTIGHSTRTHEELYDLLLENSIDFLVDVRSYPSSRYCPQWNLVNIVHYFGPLIQYEHQPLLGGKRKPRPAEESFNRAWRNASFRGFGDYMQSADFEEGLDWLLDLEDQYRVVIMCSEAVWWKCHRSMIADALAALNHEVFHIMGPGKVELHQLRDFAVVDSLGRVSYPKE